MPEIVFKPIGQIKARFADSDIRAEAKDLQGELEVFPEFEPALEGIDGYSHLFVLAKLVVSIVSPAATTANANANAS